MNDQVKEAVQTTEEEQCGLGPWRGYDYIEEAALRRYKRGTWTLAPGGRRNPRLYQIPSGIDVGDCENNKHRCVIYNSKRILRVYEYDCIADEMKLIKKYEARDYEVAGLDYDEENE